MTQPSPDPDAPGDVVEEQTSVGLGGLSGPMPRQMTGRFRRADSGVRPGSTLEMAGLADAVAAELRAGEMTSSGDAPVDDAPVAVPVVPVEVSPDPSAALGEQLAANPADVRLRMRYARALLDGGDTTSAATQVSLVLQQYPGNPMAQALLQATMAATVSALRQPTSAPPTAPLATF